MSNVLQVTLIWLMDYALGATGLLAAFSVATLLIREPVKRMALAWLATAGLLVLAIACAMPFWPRVALVKQIDTYDSAAALPRPAAVSPAPTARPVAPAPTRPLVMLSPRPAQIAAPQHRGISWFTQIDLPITLVAVYLIGAAVMLAWLLIGAIYSRRLCLAAAEAPDWAQELLRGIAGDCTRPPRLLIDVRIIAACAGGLRRPAILLPASAIDAEDRSGMRMLLAHEHAHIQHGDLWLLALDRLLLVLLYAHPLFWLLRRRIRIDQELLADAAAAEICGRGRYAESLVAWARRQPQAKWRFAGAAGGVGIFERPSQLSRRIVMLLDERIRLSASCSRRWRTTAATFAIVAIATLSLITLRPAPVAIAAAPLATEDEGKSDEANAESGKMPLVQVAATDAPAQDPTKITLSGVCLDERKKPIADARVRLFRIEHSNTSVVFDSERMKISTAPLGGLPVPEQTSLGGAQRFYDPKSQRLLAEARSDAEGKVHFDGVVIDKAVLSMSSLLQVVAQAPGRASYIGDVYYLLKLYPHHADKANDEQAEALRRAAQQTLELSMPKAATLRGRIFDEDHQPVVGAIVIGPESLNDPVPGINCAVSDAQGRYEIDDLRPFNINDLPVLPEPLPFSVEFVSAAASVRHPKYADQVVEFTKLPSEVDAVLKRPAAFSGTVVMSDSGQPAAATLVSLSCENGMQRTARCDEEGRYLLTSLPPGKCSVSAELYGERPRVDTSALLEAGENRLDLKLTPGGFIKGRIIDDQTGKPFTGEQINVIAVAGEGEAARGATGYVKYEDGTFSFAVPPGRNRIQIFATSWLHLVDADRWTKTGIDVAEGQTVEIELHVGPPPIVRLFGSLMSALDPPPVKTTTR